MITNIVSRFRRPRSWSIAAVFCLAATAQLLPNTDAWASRPVNLQAADELSATDFVDLLRNDRDRRNSVISAISKNWQPGFTPMVLEVLQLVRDPGYRRELFALLEKNTGQLRGASGNDWFQWYWAQEERQEWEHYAEFKSQMYRLIDPKFSGYFAEDRPLTIALDEVRWGGVGQDGIPPLRQPRMIPAKAAKYLGDRNIVFGLEINGEARAYPKRIMAWHEMFVDQIAGLDVAGVYCTLCGSMVLYETTVNGVNHEVGTSGFLFRSNKLMYDQATQSLWNTLWGTPVIGPLVGKGIELPRRSIVTTRWGDWKRRHPDTTVLSLDTGYERDYSEGAAYREYFATDELMFTVPELDRRLKNKDEVLSLVFPNQPDDQLAIAVKYLAKRPVYEGTLGAVNFVVLTDRSGASRVYASEGLNFTKFDGRDKVTDDQGQTWSLTETELRLGERTLKRLPSHRSFWFGWFAAYPKTKLIS